MHDLSLAMNHADHVIVLAQGALAADGAPGEALGANVLRGVGGAGRGRLGRGRAGLLWRRCFLMGPDVAIRAALPD
jgi:iron complex transport system ATP-binding protein